MKKNFRKPVLNFVPFSSAKVCEFKKCFLQSRLYPENLVQFPLLLIEKEFFH
eukprot:TRINITY_DN2457_c2_g1_i1.p3 TRINITY_DN2457_c2_g1~~TRINITY_DN2457_c2_g1_i1.p3  ORF type:complete len:52 (-),score=7.17 TRINITY_DN2457_c2_g1_i1:249-404(-)